jgi:hypothetical protein
MYSCKETLKVTRTFGEIGGYQEHAETIQDIKILQRHSKISRTYKDISGYQEHDETIQDIKDL